MAAKATAKIESALTHKQEMAIAALVSEPTMKDAAARASVSEVTLWRWLQLASSKKPIKRREERQSNMLWSRCNRPRVRPLT